MSRLPDLDIANLSADQQQVYDAVASGPRGIVAGPMLAWLQSPKFADCAQQLGAYCRFASQLPPSLSETAILMVAAHWNVAFEWETHEPIARKAGVSSDVIASIRLRQRPAFPDERAGALYDFCADLLDQRKVRPETWKQALEQFGAPALVDLIGILGYYEMISMTLAAFEIEPMAGGDAFMAIP